MQTSLCAALSSLELFLVLPIVAALVSLLS